MRTETQHSLSRFIEQLKTSFIMEKKNFLNPQELFNTMREIRRQANDNIIALMKANNLTYVHTDVDVCADADCDICCCHIFDNKTGGEYISTVQGVRLTATDKLEIRLVV